jgi:antitoxin MazE
MKIKLAKWGNSIGLRLPKAVADEVQLKEGDELDVRVEEGDLRLRRQVPARLYSLEEMLAEMDRLGSGNRPGFIDFGPDVGAEIIDDDESQRQRSTRSGRPRLGRSQTNTRKRTKRRKTRRRSD